MSKVKPAAPVSPATSSHPKYGGTSSLDLLSCAICAGRYKTPKVLPCLHTFCQSCLASAIPTHSLSVTCPVCRQQSILPEEGVQALQTNAFIQNINDLLQAALSSPCHGCGEVQSRRSFKCLDCLQILCDNCRVRHVTMNVVNNNDLSGADQDLTNAHNDTTPSQPLSHPHPHSHSHDTHKTHASNVNSNPDSNSNSNSNPFHPECPPDRVNGATTATTRNTTAAATTIHNGHGSNLNGINRIEMNNTAITTSGSDFNEPDSLEEDQEDFKIRPEIPHHNVVSIDELISSMSLTEDSSRWNEGGGVATSVAATVGSSDLMSCSSDCLSVNDNGGGGGGVGGSNSNSNATLLCPSHEGNDLKYYCSHCETAVCETCTQTEHIGHLTVVLSEAIIEHKTSLTSLVSKVRQMIPQVISAMEVVEDTRENLSQNTYHAELQIAKTYGDVIRLVEARKKAVLEDLAAVSKSKEKILNDQKKALKAHLLRMTDSCELTQDSLAHGKDTDVVMVKKEMSGKLHDLISHGPTLQPETNDLLPFDHRGLDTARACISKLGTVPSNAAVPFFTTAGGEAFSQCVCLRPASITVTTRNKDEQLITCGFVPFESFISTDMTEDRIVPDITDQDNGTYDFNFVLPNAGIYYLTILMFGQHIKGSPYKIRVAEFCESHGGSSRMPRSMAVKPRGVKRPSSSRSQGSGTRRSVTRVEDDLIMRIGGKGRNRGEFFNPQGLCFCNDKVVVADSNNQNVQVFAPSGECKLRFGSAGRMPGKVQRPTGVAMTHNGHFLIADYDNRWISVFDDHGKYLSRIGNGKLQGPKGITVDKEGRIIVVDNKSSCILVFQANGKFLHKFGSRGNSECQFAGPHYVAVGKSNDIFISDFHNHCIKVFDSCGHFKFSFGSNGEGNGQFNAPTGVAVDERGNVLVADWGNSRVQVFDSSGSFLSYINTSSEPLYGPQGLAVTSQGVAVVADSGNHCIKYYKYLQ